MARPAQSAIDMFMSITGTSEAVAVQKLEEHGGDLNQAVNSHFNEGDGMNSHTASVPATQDDLMDVDDPVNLLTGAPAPPLISASRRLNPFSILDSHFGQRFFDGGSSRAPRVSHPRDVREIPIEFKDENTQLASLGSGPKIEDVTGSASEQGPVVHGTVIIDDEDEVLPSAPAGAYHFGSISGGTHPGPNVTPLTDAIDYTNDIEEEMIQAAIEASKREAEEYGKQQYDVSNSLSGSKLDGDSSILEDTELAHAVSLSLKTAEREKVLRGQSLEMGEQSSHASDSRTENSGNSDVANGWQGPVRSRSQISNQSNMEEEDTSFEDEAYDVDEEPLVRNRPTHAASGDTSQQILSPPPSSPQHQQIGRRTQDDNGDSFKLDEWGGISSEEHDEAVMLEAAIFGGIPEGTSYHFAYPHRQVMQSSFDRVPRPPSPRLAEQRMLREQQDDEYLASLQADRDKELKAIQEAEKHRLEEAAAIEAALKRGKHQEEEAHRKQREEEEFERKLAAKQASLPQEPSVDDENSVTLLIRMPDGSRCGRRFLKSDKLQFLYDYLDVGRLVKPGSYRLVRPYPRRSFMDEESQLCLSELGLSSKQEALFLELI